MIDYSVKVRGSADKPMYLWGSNGIKVTHVWPLLLTIRNDVLGERVTFGTERISEGRPPGRETIGTLLPGESYTLPLLNLKGVFAFCDPDLDSTVQCTLTMPQLPAAG
jgi:hypothetical protein